ncbi:hypothetical protein LOTGIDRAFT_208987 [Lottia gigantea]|uniref:Acyl-CoA synthetase short-chain family member 3, mitochondrial n=1 Tax=Lottia gigantea TaxID=225164 RepID=V4A1Z8_LOTGI|nr:hypothetical protein LOTGIDRAFT_208987 [Lottia gigantea]ESO97833.1 hypothetical protein LOTGIDRAFT_208987 [Lottia gigantea]
MAWRRRALSLCLENKHFKVDQRVLNAAVGRNNVSAQLQNHAYGTSSKGKSYDDVFNQSIKNPDEFWAEAADQLVWNKKWNKVLDNSKSPFTEWFSGGEISTCYNAVDRHVDSGRGDNLALIHDSPVTNTVQKITYKQLQQKVSKLAGVLRKYGVNKGDTVLIYMPMIPEAVITIMACTRIGAIHSLVFGGFAAKELSVRINHLAPKVVVSANCGVEPNRIVPYKPMLHDALNMIEFKPNKCVIFNRPGFDRAPMTKNLDVCWEEEMSDIKPVDCVPVLATDPVYILYTSGTTGLPKAVVRPNGGHAVMLNWSMSNVFGIAPGEVWWAASDLGWVVGHSYIAYAPLLNGSTSVIYEGKPVGTPDAGKFFQVIKDHNINGMFTAPTALRAIRAADSEGEISKKYLPFTDFRALFVAGEHCDHETMEWTRKAFDCPVLDNWWQTETGCPMSATCVGLGMDSYPTPGVAGKPVPGWNIHVLRPDGTECNDNEFGQIAVKLPLPPAAFSTLYKSEDRFLNTYFKTIPGYYDTMDSGFRDEKGYIAVMARTDDVINVAGHRLSTGSLEEAILENKDIVETAVIGVKDELKGQVPVALCVIKQGRFMSCNIIDIRYAVFFHVFHICSRKEVCKETKSMQIQLVSHKKSKLDIL